MIHSHGGTLPPSRLALVFARNKIILNPCYHSLHEGEELQWLIDQFWFIDQFQCGGSLISTELPLK